MDSLTPAQGVILTTGQTGIKAGRGISARGDLNGDGCSDLVVGSAYATGIDSAYVIYGGRQE